MNWADELDALNAEHFRAKFKDRIRWRRGVGWMAYDGRQWLGGAFAEEAARSAASELPALMAAEAIAILLAADRHSGPERKLERTRGNRLLARAGQTCDAARREHLLARAAELMADDQWLI